jgi:hypothetical protein
MFDRHPQGVFGGHKRCNIYYTFKRVLICYDCWFQINAVVEKYYVPMQYNLYLFLLVFYSMAVSDTNLQS